MNRPGRQKGVALMIVLMIVALVSVLATEMGSRLQLQVQRTMNITDSNQAYWYAMGAEAFARKSITTLMEETKEKITLNQPWSQEFTYPLDGGGLKARLEDMQSCFNLNALLEGADPNNPRQQTLAMEAFQNMLLATEIDALDNYTAETVRDSLADWLDEDDIMRPYGAEDSTYEGLENPYLAANGLLSAQSELRLINGVSADWLNAILPLVCVIPDNQSLRINVNTLTEERVPLLVGLTGISQPQAENLISSRPQEGWDDPQDFLSQPAVQALNLPQDKLQWFTVTTEYFMLHTKTRYNKANFTMSSIFHVDGDNNVSVMRREYGGVD
ncbi:type II secretion system minor pseudopilin GspK [Alteromonas halophila]|uniref:Type II secretion system protein K n=1 Tax=Alteromonas halophila TaxID=516698 RepID=A0A918JMR9_9ALTE|nr:type II secretion system minor pseudopilin GspK [Alteromonas halophila]GGW90763.1 type II secretion system protein K [Alteromonas halophila]